MQTAVYLRLITMKIVFNIISRRTSSIRNYTLCFYEQHIFIERRIHDIIPFVNRNNIGKTNRNIKFIRENIKFVIRSRDSHKL
jgi:hypothetical protein